MPEEAAETLNFTVHRESGFARFYSDNAAALVVGPDIEISFMVATPTLSGILSDGDPGGNTLNLEASFVELCRVRMSNKAAVSTAFNVIFALLQEGMLDVEKLRTNIDGMISSTESTPKGETDAG